MTTATARPELLPHVGISPEELWESYEAAARPPMQDLIRQWRPSPLVDQHRTFVWGAGDPETARILLIGEAPGRDEVATGIPFVGPAGQVLSSALHKAGLSRARDVYIVNTVTQPPPALGGRPIGPPRPRAMWAERERLFQITEVLRPQVILLMGRFAAANFMAEALIEELSRKNVTLDTGRFVISRALGWHEQGVHSRLPCPTAVTYHPSYFLYLRDRTSGQHEVFQDAVRQFITTLSEAKERLQ